MFQWCNPHTLDCATTQSDIGPVAPDPTLKCMHQHDYKMNNDNNHDDDDIT